MNKIIKGIRRAIKNYDMIQEGDFIAVGLSGGKDSSAMLKALSMIRTYDGVPSFDVVAIHINAGFNDIEDTTMANFCEALGVKYIEIKTDIARILKERNESNPCSLCANIRRGALVNTALKLGCNKLALGHHSDDVTSTFLLSLLYESRLSTIQPVVSGESRLTLIRPMLYVEERDISNAVKRIGIPVYKNPCPHDHFTEREHMKRLLTDLTKDIPDSMKHIKSALFNPERNNLLPPKHQ